MAETVSREWIEEQRAYNYHRTPERKIESPRAALEFVDEVGFCHFWPIKGTELPNLFQAIAGCSRPVPMEHDDPDIDSCWSWKDDALGQRQWYYGKLLRRRATLISLEELPAFYAASENLGDLDDYLEEYSAGLMTAEAKWICQALLEEGPLDTIRLREKAGLSSGGAKARFDRALVELQAGLKVLPIGVARVGHWRYAFTYELLLRHFPELAEQSRDIKRGQAQRRLVGRYVENVVAVDRAMIKGLFNVLKWIPTELERAIAALLEQGEVRETQVEGFLEPQLVSVRCLEEAA